LYLGSPVESSIASFFDLFDDSGQIAPRKALSIESLEPFRGKALDGPRASSPDQPQHKDIDRQHRKAKREWRDPKPSSHCAAHGEKRHWNDEETEQNCGGELLLAGLDVKRLHLINL
jgi:hypothetical protein